MSYLSCLGLTSPLLSSCLRLGASLLPLAGATSLTGCRQILGLPDRAFLDPDSTPDATGEVDALPDADAESPGPEFAPAPKHPPLGLVLPPQRAFLSWRNAEIPEGKSVFGYRVCYTTKPDDPSLCPNESIETRTHRVIDSLTESVQYFWKVQACYDAASKDCSGFSALRTFSTDNSLLGWWRFDETTGTTATDSGGGGNHGTLPNGASWSSGLVGNALQCDGNDYVLVGNKAALEGMKALTLELFINTTSKSTGPAILSKWGTASGSYVVRLSGTDPGRISLAVDTGAPVVVESSSLVNNGKWHYVVGTYDGALQNLYIDLVLEASAPQSGFVAKSAHDFCLGMSCTGGAGVGTGFSGLIDDVSVYNTSLSPEVLLNHFCAVQAESGADPLPGNCQ